MKITSPQITTMTVKVLRVVAWHIFCKFLLVIVQFYPIIPNSFFQEVDNVLVIVTRYFGGILLGADRFKHINQAARNSLEMGGFLDTVDDKKPGRTKKKR